MAKRLNYEYKIGFTGDTSQLEAAVKKATESLDNLGRAHFGSLNKDLKEGAQAALQLSANLKQAYNSQTGELNLTTFNNSLKQSGLTIEQYSTKLQSLGPAGREAFLEMAQAVGMAELPLRRSNALLSSLWTTMKNTARWQLSSGMLHSFVGAVSTAYGYTQDLNESLNSIRIVTSKSTEDMARFAEEANKAAKELSTTTIDYTDASLIYYQQGLDDEAVRARTDVTIKLANAAGESAEKASQQMTAIWNNFAKGSENLEYYADVLTALGASTASSTEEISAGLQKFAGIANTVGLSYEYAAASLATITATTRESAETVGTALRTLFGRLEGLKLGETLEDGTDLNKYSKALMQVGVDIKDSSGNLKDMDSILDEIMDKWQGLTRDQQMALAQTVAGVRQYAQFITLMDKSDFFKENVATARGSAGALQEQANIYAESWEAARDRVRAAAEDVYDSLINENFFIGLDNALTPVLTGVAKFIDGLGGMKGTLITIGAIVTRVFEIQIVSGLQNARLGLLNIIGLEGQYAREIQARVNIAVQNLDFDKETNVLLSTRGNILKEEIRLKGLLNEYDGQLAEATKNQIAGQQAILKLLDEEIVRRAETAQNAQENAQEQKGNLLLNLRTNAFEKYKPNSKKFKNTFSAVDPGIKTTEEAAENLLNKLEEAEQKLAKAQRRLVELESQAEKTGEKSQQEADEAARDIANATQEINKAKMGLNALAQNKQDVDQIEQSFRKSAQATADVEKELEELKAKYEELLALVKEGALSPPISWSQAFTEVSQGLMGLSMAWQGIQSLGRLFSDEDISAGERFSIFLSSIVSLSFGIPSIVNGLKGLHTVLRLVGQTSEKAAVGAITNAGAEKVEGQGAKGDAMAQELRAEATKKANAEALAGLKILGPYLIAIAAVAAVVFLFVKAKQAEENAIKKATEAIQTSTEEFNKSKESVNSLNTELDTLQKRIKELKDQGPLTITEANELRTLEAQEASIERRLEAEKELLALKAQETAKTIDTNYQKASKPIQLTSLAEEISSTSDPRRLRSVNSLIKYLKNSKSEREGLDQWFEDQQKRFKGNAIALARLTQQYDKYSEKLTQIEAQNGQILNDNIVEREQRLLTYLDAVDKGAVRNETTVKNLIKDIDDAYSQLYDDNQYLEKRILPLTKLESVIQAFKTGDFNTDELVKDLERAAVPVEKLQNAFDTIKETLVGQEKIFADDNAFTSYLNKFGDKGIPALVALSNSLKDVEDEAQLTAMIINEIASQNVISVQFEVVKNAGYEALEKIRNGEFLDADTIQTLKEQFQSIFDLGNIEDLPLNDQVSVLQAAIAETLNPEDTIDILQIDLEKEKEKLAELEHELEHGADAASYEVKIAISKASIQKMKQQIEENLSKTPFELQVEIDKYTINSIAAELGVISKAVSYIGDDFKVQAKDIANLAKTMPEIFKNALWDVNKDYVQLNESTLNEIKNLYNETTEANRVAAFERLKTEIGNASDILGITQALANDQKIINGEITEDYINKKFQELGVTKDQKQEIVKLRIIQKLEELAQSEETKTNKEADLQTEANANKSAAETNAKNWFQSSQKMATDYHAALVAMQTDRESFVNGNNLTAMSRRIISEYKPTYTNKISYETVTASTSNKYRDQKNAVEALFEKHGNVGRAADLLNLSIKDFADLATEAFTTAGVEIKNNLSLTWRNLVKNPSKYLSSPDISAADFGKMAGIEEKQIQNLANEIQKLMLPSDLDNWLKGKSSGKGSKSGGSGSKSKELKELDEFDTRYHEINEEIEKQDRLLKKINTDIDRAYGTEKLEKYQKSIKALNGQAENYLAKSREAAEYLEVDFKRAEAAAQKFGASLTIGEEGDILNYTDVLRNAYLQLSKVHASQNEEAYNQAKENFDNLKKLMDQYVETLKIQRENFDAYEDKRREIRDQELKNITYKLEVAIDIKQLRQDIRDFSKEIEESFGDALTHGLKVFDLNTEQAKEEMAMYDTYLQQYNELKDYWANDDSYSSMEDTREAMKNLISEIINSGGNLLDWIDYWENMVPEAINAARERFDQFTNQLKHNTTILDSIKELYALQGQTYKTAQGFERLQRTASEKVNASLTDAMLNRDWYERTKVNLLDAQRMLDSLNGDESDVRWDAFKKNRDALLKEFNDAEEAYLASAKEAMETAKDMYLEQIEKAAYDFAQALAKTGDLDFLSQQYDHFIDQEERYLDAVNTAYEKQNWWNKIEQDINNSTNKAQQEKLRLFYEEEVVQRSLNGLNKYDLDIIEAKYKVMQAQMALEDAQNAKNNLRLVRDRQGNWNYQYTADQAEVDDANSELADAENEWYNIAKQQVKDVTGQIIDTWKEAQEAIKEVYDDMTLTDEERAARATEIYDYYCQKIKDLEREKQVSVKDMTEAGQSVLEDFSTSYIDTLGGMSTSNQDFTVALQDYMNQCRENMREYQDTVHEVAVESSTDLGHLDQKLDDTTEANNKLRETGLRTVDQLQNSITTVYNTAMAYQELAQSIMETVRAMQELAGMQARDIENMSRGGSGDYDHSLAMIQAAQNRDWDTYADEARLHDAKVAANGMGNVWSSDQISALIYAAQKENDASAIALLNQIGNGAYFTDDYWDNWNNAGQNLNDATDRMVDLLEALYRSASGATGMYTGTWNNNGGRLAFLHQKELVLNQDDTKNILDAVAMVRNSFEQRSFEISGLMASRIGNVRPAIPVDPDPRVSTNYFDVSFPNATSHIEIEQAIRNLANDATQFVNIQKQ